MALSFLAWFCPTPLYEGIEGDLMQQFETDVKVIGPRKARQRFWLNALMFFRPGIILRNKIAINPFRTVMITNYLTIAFRNIQKRKLYSAINAFGLSVGFAFCMLIYLFIGDEKSFDQFQVNKDRIYRIEEVSYNYWTEGLKPEQRYMKSASVQLGLKDLLKKELPEVEFATRFNGGGGVVKYKDKVFREDINYTDADFFRMFSFRLLAGNPNKLFENKSDAVITPAIAEKYFGDEDPIGKTIIIDSEGEKAFTVAGVIEPPPANSSISYKILLPQENRRWYERNMTNWGNFSTPTIVQLFPGSSEETLARNLEKVIEKHLSATLEQWRKDDNVPADIKLLQYQFTKLPDWHFKKEIRWAKVSDPQYSYILGGIALLILLIAGINYVSLALTTSAARRTEVGIRKVAGAVRRQLVLQFSVESIMVALISAVLGILLMALFLPSFNQFTGKEIALEADNIAKFLTASLVLAFVVGGLAGSYPALFLSNFRPALVLKGRFTTKVQAGFTRPLVALQFAMSAFLIISSVIMYRQMEFVTSKDLGYNKDQVIVVPTQRGWRLEADRVVSQFRTRLLQEKEIISVAGTSISFNQGGSVQGYKVGEQNKQAFVYAVDPDYIPTLGIKLVHGRNFDPGIASDTAAVIVNEALVRDMKWTDLDDAYLNWINDTLSNGDKVIGVVKDYHYNSLEEGIKPMLLSLRKRAAGHLGTMLIKVNQGNLVAANKKISAAWKELYPDQPYEYTFLDEDVALQYQAHTRWMNIMGLSTTFAILISCLGLFGLAGINAMNRTKEMGIRKVLGAGIASIFILLNRQYVWISLISFAIAIPFSWYVMDRWLSDFEFRITVGWEIFVASMILGLVVALLTVSYHAIKTSMVNPAETLKYE